MAEYQSLHCMMVIVNCYGLEGDVANSVHLSVAFTAVLNCPYCVHRVPKCSSVCVSNVNCIYQQ
jgi:hypothetical protein